MENKKNKFGIIAGITAFVLFACFFVFAIGFGGYQLFKNSQQKVDPIPSLTPSDGETSFGIEEENSDSGKNNDGTEESTTTNPIYLDISQEIGVIFKPFWYTRNLLHDNFLEQPIDDKVLAQGAINGIENFLDQNDLSLANITVPEDSPSSDELATAANTPSDIYKTFLPFWDVWGQLSYIELPTGTTQLSLMRHALVGMVSGLDDPYTNYFDPDLAERWNTDLSGEYEGIGAWVDVDGEFLTIISPIKGTPAEEAGLKPGDQIIAIDGDDMSGVDPNVALKRVLGNAGTKVILTISRKDVAQSFEVEIIRRKILMPYIETEILENDIAYIKLLRFYDGGDIDFRNALEELLDENPKGLIFDLRGNPGGYLQTVVNITSEFITEGNVLIEEFSDNSQKNYPMRNSKGIATTIPIVVLVDQGSASASEIFAGAIKDYERGVIVGQTTFGKGLVQLPISLPDDQGLVSITIARWLTPLGRTIHEIGVEPDYFVEITESDIELELDPQLDKALELIRAIEN